MQLHNLMVLLVPMHKLIIIPLSPYIVIYAGVSSSFCAGGQWGFSDRHF